MYTFSVFLPKKGNTLILKTKTVQNILRASEMIRYLCVFLLTLGLKLLFQQGLPPSVGCAVSTEVVPSMRTRDLAWPSPSLMSQGTSK